MPTHSQALIEMPGARVRRHPTADLDHATNRREPVLNVEHHQHRVPLRHGEHQGTRRGPVAGKVCGISELRVVAGVGI